MRRIARRMGVRELDKLGDYCNYLKQHTEECEALLKDLLISVTNFFRDRDAFAYMEREIVPAILRNRKAKDSVRVWVTACATAREARYTNADVADVSPERLQRFFVKEGPDVYRVRRELRETVLFAHHNVLRAPPLSRPKME